MQKIFLKSTRFHFIVGACALLLVVLDFMIITKLVKSQKANEAYTNVLAFYVDYNDQLYLLTDTLGILRYDSDHSYLGRFHVSSNSDIIRIFDDNITICDYDNRYLFVYNYDGQLQSSINNADDIGYDFMTATTNNFSSTQAQNGAVYELKCSDDYYEVYKNGNDVIYHTPDKGYKIKTLCTINLPVTVIVFLIAVFNIAVVIWRNVKRSKEKTEGLFSN